jgi:GAF domain-containing protein
VVGDVEKFPGHIACDSRSKSEIVIPLKDNRNNIIGVMDVDSTDLNAFDEVDNKWLQKIIELV